MKCRLFLLEWFFFSYIDEAMSRPGLFEKLNIEKLSGIEKPLEVELQERPGPLPKKTKHH